MTQPASDIKIPATNANWSTGPRVGQPTRVANTAAQLADGIIAGQSIKAELLNDILHNLALWVDHMRDDYIGQFGNAADGNVTIAAGTTVLTRDMYYGTLRIEPGGILDANGYKIFAWLLVFEAGGQIQNNGSNGGNAGGAVGTSGAGASFGSLGFGSAGGIGAEDAVGVGGTALSNGIGGAGGAGGATTGVVRAGGVGGAQNPPAANDGGYDHVGAAMGVIFGTTNGATAQTTVLQGGAGGGSGASVAAGGRSGGGGGGGGVISIHAHTILIDPDATPAIQANGGDAGTPTGPVEVGGSGGGGGGAILIAYRRLLDGTNVATATPREPADLAAAGIIVEALGGAPSNGINGGDNGVAGSDGSVRWWQI